MNKILLFFAIVYVSILVWTNSVFAEKLEIQLGETKSYEDLQFYFNDVNDSRCPSDVTCIWEGKVSIMIDITRDIYTIGGPLEMNTPMKFFE